MLNAIDPEPPVSITVAAGSRTQIAWLDSERIALYVWPVAGVATVISLSPFSDTTADGVNPFDGQGHVAILSAQYPFYCQGDWYCVNTGLLPFDVWVSSLRRRG